MKSENHASNINREIPNLPALFWPFPVHQSPYIELLEEGAINFLDRFKLYPDIKSREWLVQGRISGGLTGLLYPAGPFELQQIAADFSALVFACDDYYCDEGPTRDNPGLLVAALVKIVRAIESPEYIIDSSNCYALAFRDLRIRMDKLAPPEQVALWADVVKGWFLAEVFKVHNVQSKIMPDLNDAALLRLLCGGGRAYVALATIVRQIKISPRTWEDRRLRAMAEMADMVLNWGSEIYSYYKEAHRSPGHDHNMVDVVAHHYGYTGTEIINGYVRIYELLANRFIELRRAILTSTDDPVIREFVDSLVDYVGGGLVWSQLTRRYLYVDVGPGQQVTFTCEGLTDIPRSISSEAPPIPCIAWWWEVSK